MRVIPLDADWHRILTSSAPGSFSLTRQFAMLGGLGALIILLNLNAPAQLTAAQRLLASAIIALAAVPVWLWRSGIDRSIPFLPFIAIVFAGYYAVPMFFVKRLTIGLVPKALPDELVSSALALALFGCVCIFCGYYSPLQGLLDSFIPKVKMRWQDVEGVRNWALAFSAIGIAAWFLLPGEEVPVAITQLESFAKDFWILGILILFALQLTGSLGIASKFLLWGVLVPLRFIAGLLTGLSGQAFVVVFVVVFLYSSMRRRIPWSWLLVGALVAVAVRPVQLHYRMLTWGGSRFPPQTIMQKFSAYADISSDVFAQGPRLREFAMEIAAQRAWLIPTLVEVMRDTPDHVPYWYGHSYAPLLYKPIPRFLWAAKPEEETGQTFGRRYGLLGPASYETSYNFPQLVEAYANFGLPGVAVVMFLLGVAYRMLLRIFVHPRMGFGAVIAGVYLAASLFDIGSATSLVLGGIPWTLAFLALINVAITLSPLGRYPASVRSAEGLPDITKDHV